MCDLLKVDDSGELDLNFVVDGEEKTEVGSLTSDDEIQGDLNMPGQNESPSLPADFRNENQRSMFNKSPSVPTEFDHDDARRRKLDYDQGSIQSPSNDNHNQGEMDELPGSYFHKSSFEFEAQTFHHERGTEDSAHSQESLPTADGNQVEETEGNSIIDHRPNTIREYEKVKDDFVEKSPNEFTKSPYNETEGEIIEQQREDLYSNPASPLEAGEHRHYSVPHSPGSFQKRSKSPVTQMSVSPTPHRQKHSFPPERSDLAKRTSSHGHLSPSATRTSASPKRSRQRSRHKDGSSLKRMSASPEPRYSPKKYQRLDRSISRSPLRRKDSSSGYRRDYRDRSRSRSPYARDRHMSPRRRFSPRRRSPPGHHSRRHSPRRRPWSPPPNRRTGVGKPGRNLFVAGFSFLTTERDLERKFSRYGRVRDVRIVRDKRSGDSRGFGFLSLERDEDADAAIRALDETEWNGRVILVEKSKSTR